MVEAFQIFTIFFGMASVLAAPLAVVLGLPLAAWVARAWLSVRERELRLREVEVVLQLRESRALPAWVDERDPKSLLAWTRTDRELAGLLTAGVMTAP